MLSRLRGLADKFVHQLGPVGIVVGFMLLGVIAALGIRNQQLNSRSVQLSKDIKAVGTRLVDCTTPEGKCSQEQQAKVAAYLTTQDAATAARFADALRREGEFARAMGVPQSVVDRIVNEPGPLVTFTVTTPPSAPAKPIGTLPSPRPSPGAKARPLPVRVVVGSVVTSAASSGASPATPAPAGWPCPAIHIELPNVVQLCIPPPHAP